ncbi:MAG: hypothetical protein ACR2RL_02250 [Gammaproteobacteria bacterium]
MKTQTCLNDECSPLPGGERLQYYYGRNLSVSDFQTEQTYFLEKLRLHNRCFHGMGIVCGLEVEPVPLDDECYGESDRARRQLEAELADVKKRLEASPRGEGYSELEADAETIARRLEQLPDCHPSAETPAAVIINCGWAIDCHGREIFVRAPVQVDLLSLLSATDRRTLAYSQSDKPHILELRICYCEQPTYPSRPLVSDNCDLSVQCRHERIRESFRLELDLEHLPEDCRCNVCCEPCEHDCLVLAHICWRPGQPVLEEHIDLSPRRPISVYRPTSVSGVSWLHGAVYDCDDAKLVLGTRLRDDPGKRTNGLYFQFSKPVHAETVQPGVVDCWLIEGGDGRSANIINLSGEILKDKDEGLIDGFYYRHSSSETLNSGDRVLIILRADFVLDRCCQPVDGENVGGLTPQLPDYYHNPAPTHKPPAPPPCADRPWPWTSGNRQPGSSFESWIFIG